MQRSFQNTLVSANIGCEKMFFPLFLSLLFLSFSSLSSQLVTLPAIVSSADNVFQLGIFQPDGSMSRWFLGIWYKKDRERTCLWVANGNRPLTEPNATLTFVKNDLVLFDQAKMPVWSANLTGGDVSSQMVIQLQDTGNLVVKDSNDRYLWQSFDHPSDTLLPHMKLGFDVNTKFDKFLTSWSSRADQTPGYFFLEIVDRGAVFAIGLWDRKKVYRSIEWNGNGFSDMPPVMTKDDTGALFSLKNNNSILKLGPEGDRVLYTWIPTSMVWELQWSVSKDGCTRYPESSENGKDGCMTTSLDTTSTDATTRKPWLIVLIVLIVGVPVSAMIFCLWKWIKRGATTTPGPTQTEIMMNEIAGEDRFTIIELRTIVEATDNFSDSNELGRGGFGIVYKAILPNGTEAAVKRLSTMSSQGVEEFKNEVRTILNVLHKNLVRLHGFCCEQGEKILVYEFMQNSSLNRYLFDATRSPILTWEMRFRIIGEIAQGLSYLHYSRESPIIHRDLKPSNILLDRNMISKISDFGMSKILENGQTEAETQTVVGTYGYMAEEYARSNIMSDKSDVFSFGVMILEIITGQRNLAFCYENPGDSLLGLAWRTWNQGNGLQLVDSHYKDASLVEEQVLRCLQIGLCCVQDKAEDRPSTDLLVVMLKSRTAEIPLPQEPDYYYARYLGGDTGEAASSSSLAHGIGSTVLAHTTGFNEITVTAMDRR